MIWSPQQDAALAKVDAWFRSRRRAPVFRLFGYAGTGKTTLAIEIANRAGGNVVFAAFTGKAALVMSRKGCNPCSTIHKLIYVPKEDPETGEFVFKLKPKYESMVGGADLVIIDECSMVNEQIGKDLLSFGKPVLVLGDPAQLPPVDGAGFFTENVEPDVMLTEIHRQAEGNPIIKLATLARNAQPLPRGTIRGEYNGAVSVISSAPDSSLLAADQIICGTNATRKSLNHRMRKLHADNLRISLDTKIAHAPVVGDRVICLKNRHDRGIMNGSLWDVMSIDDRAPNARKPGPVDVSFMKLRSTDDPEFVVHAATPHRFFSTDPKKEKLEKNERHLDEFDFGYAITCHKAQGSQWDKVLIHDQSFAFREDAHRWLYTALTRAADKLIVVQS